MPEYFPFEGRTDMIKYLEDKGIPCSVSASKPYSMDHNLLHGGFEFFGVGEAVAVGGHLAAITSEVPSP